MKWSQTMTTDMKSYINKRANQDKFVEKSAELVKVASPVVDWLESGHMTPIYEEDVAKFIKLYRALENNTLLSS